MVKGQHVVYQCPYCDECKVRKSRVDKHIAKVHAEEHRRCDRDLVKAPQAAGNQAAAPQQQKRRKGNDGAVL